MKPLIATLTLVLTLCAQEAKVTPPDTARQEVRQIQAEGSVTDAVRQQWRAVKAELKEIETRHVAAFQAEAKQLMEERTKIIVSVCKSMGMTEEEIVAQCKYAEQDEAGKPIPLRIYRQATTPQARSKPEARTVPGPLDDTEGPKGK